MGKYQDLQLPQSPTKLGATIGGRFDSLVNNVLESRCFETLQSGVSSSIGTGDILPELVRLVRRLKKHLPSAEAGLLGQASGLLV